MFDFMSVVYCVLSLPPFLTVVVQSEFTRGAIHRGYGWQ